MTTEGQPVEFILLPGSTHDMKAFQKMSLKPVPKGANIYANQAYNSASYEDLLWEDQGIALLSPKKASNKRQYTRKIAAYINKKRKRIETAFSEIKSWLGQRVHAATLKGFKLKLALNVVAFAFKTLLAS